MAQVVRPPAGLRSSTLHAVGAVPKHDPGAVRMVHDAARPTGRALNDAVRHLRRRFVAISDIAAGVSPGCFAAKADVCSYYCTLVSTLPSGTCSLSAFPWSRAKAWTEEF